MSEATTIEAVIGEVNTLDKEISKLDVQMNPSAVDGVVGAVAVTPEQLGSFYKNIRPILVLTSKLWFFPAKWQSLLTTFLTYMDALTGTTEGNLG